jgi:SAM-dependent methyltransferase
MELRELGDSSTGNDLKPKTWGGFWDIFGEVLVDFLELQKGESVLDIGTGGGSVLYPALIKVGSTGNVIGVETCQHCVDATSSEIKRCGLNNTKVHFMDAREADFEGQLFDCVTAGFIGWDDYFDFDTLEYKKPDELMSSICRLLKPGGKFGMSTWLMQEDLDWMYGFLKAHSIECRRNYHIENEDGWQIILTEAGFSDIRVLRKSATYTYRSVDYWWKEMMDYDWILDKENNDVITDSIKRDALLAIQELLTRDGGVPFKRDAIFVSAIKRD